MNKNISEEIIEIGGKEYTLFLNRTGIVNWEKMTKLSEKAENYKELASNLQKVEEVEITDETNPFEMYGDYNEDALNEQIDEMKELYVKFYWIALYTHHKLSLTQVRELFDIAEEEYGLEQLGQLANQMVENANKDLVNKERKNLKALKSVKQN